MSISRSNIRRAAALAATLCVAGTAVGTASANTPPPEQPPIVSLEALGARVTVGGPDGLITLGTGAAAAAAPAQRSTPAPPAEPAAAAVAPPVAETTAVSEPAPKPEPAPTAESTPPAAETPVAEQEVPVATPPATPDPSEEAPTVPADGAAPVESDEPAGDEPQQGNEGADPVGEVAPETGTTEPPRSGRDVPTGVAESAAAAQNSPSRPLPPAPTPPVRPTPPPAAGGAPPPLIELGVNLLGISADVAARLTTSGQGLAADVDVVLAVPGLVEAAVDVGLGVGGNTPLAAELGLQARLLGEAPPVDAAVPVPPAVEVPLPEVPVETIAPPLAAVPALPTVEPVVGPSARTPVRTPVVTPGRGGQGTPAPVAGGGPAAPIAAPVAGGTVVPATLVPSAPVAVTEPIRERETPTAASPVGAVAAAVVAAGRSPWLVLAVLLSALAYLLGQRLIDRGSRKLAHPAGGQGPDDELIQL